MNPGTDNIGKAAPEVQLGSLLDESPIAAIQRERTAFDRAAQQFSERLVLFGAGGFGKLTLANMLRAGLKPLAFTDNNSMLWGTSIDGIPVYSPSRAAELFGRDAAFLVTIWNARANDRMSKRIQQMVELGCQCVLPSGLLYWKYPDAFLPYYFLDLPHRALQSADEIRAGLGVFSDEASRREYVAQVAFRLRLDYDGLGQGDDTGHYFTADMVDLGADEVLIDCGAFDGDTIAEFVNRRGDSFASIVAFEPDSLNWERLQQRLACFPDHIRRKISTFPQALGARNEMVYFRADGTDKSKSGNGSVAVECVTLDEALRDVSPTLIKFDIEGAELSALAGTQLVISRCRPVLAVSAYHEQDHLWRVPLALSRICRDYQFFLRPCGSAGWDLVCYAVPSERLKVL